MRVQEVRPQRSTAAILLFLACLLPVALGASTGENLTVGAITLPADANSNLVFLGLVNNDGASVTGSIESDELTVCKYEARFFEVAYPEPILQLPMSVDVKEECFPLTQAKVTISADPGWIAARPDKSGSATVTTTDRAAVKPSDLTTLASIGGRIAGSDDHRKPRFQEVINESHVLYNASATVILRGDGEVRFMGPDAHIEAAENATDYDTGETTHGGTANAHERIMRWVSIRFDAATVTLDMPTRFLLAAKDVPEVRIDGNLTAENVRGVLRVGDVEYTPKSAGERAYLDGQFTATLTPTNGGKAVELKVDGFLRETSLQPSAARVPAPVGGSGVPWVPIVLGAVLATGAVAAGISWARRRAAPRAATRGATPSAMVPVILAGGVFESPEAALAAIKAGLRPSQDVLGLLLEGAKAAVERSDWSEALDYMRAARQVRPDDAGYAKAEGLYLRNLDMMDEAMVAYESAMRLGDSVAGVDAAICAVGAGDIAAALSFIEEALKEEPCHVAEIENEPALGALQGDATFERIMANARLRAS